MHKAPLPTSGTVFYMHRLVLFGTLKSAGLCFVTLTLFYSYNTFISSQSGVWAFEELRRYHTRSSQFNWGTQKYKF